MGQTVINAGASNVPRNGQGSYSTQLLQIHFF